MAPSFVLLIAELSFLPHHKKTQQEHTTRPPMPSSSNNSPQQPAATHTPQNTLRNQPQLPNSPKFGNAMGTMTAAQTSMRQGRQGQASTLPCCYCHCPTGGGSPRSKGGSTPGRQRGDQGIAVAVTAALVPWARPPTRGAWLGAALAASDQEGVDATCRSVMAPLAIKRAKRARR